MRCYVRGCRGHKDELTWILSPWSWPSSKGNQEWTGWPECKVGCVKRRKPVGEAIPQVTRWTGHWRAQVLPERGRNRPEFLGRANRVMFHSWEPRGAEQVAGRTWEPGVWHPKKGAGHRRSLDWYFSLPSSTSRCWLSSHAGLEQGGEGSGPRPRAAWLRLLGLSGNSNAKVITHASVYETVREITWHGSQ